MFNKKKFDIQERSLNFAVRVAYFVDGLPKKQSAFEYGKQLLRSSASIGANLEEADGALSRRDFINRVGISRKEAKEAWYWLQLIKRTNLSAETQFAEELRWLINESAELKLILSSIIRNTKVIT